jgi:DNA-binding HxlR family transcriptional regulator
MGLEYELTNLGGPRVCSIADALDVVGERWTLLVLRELGFGVHRFSDILTNTGAPRETLALRLRKLKDAGLIERRQYSNHPPRDEYFLTLAGQDIQSVLIGLREWGERHITSSKGRFEAGGNETKKTAGDGTRRRRRPGA